MKIYSYQRKSQFTDGIEFFIGVKNEFKSVYVEVYNPIFFNSDGSYWIAEGICHTNAENINELSINPKN